jgi:hypothetical protein
MSSVAWEKDLSLRILHSENEYYNFVYIEVQENMGAWEIGTHVWGREHNI